MRKLQKGFSIITAIFLLVVLSFLGVAMVSFSTSQNQSAAMDVMGSRAYQAARAGIEWAAYYVALSPASSPAAWTGCASAATTPIPLANDLAPFTVTVNCQAASAVEGGSTIWIYDVNSVAKTGTVGGPDYIERVMSVKLGK
jgi:MSHA biogenesis protein MshP